MTDHGQKLGARPCFQPVKAGSAWRIVESANGGSRDICGAINEAVAWETCRQLNAYRAVNP